MIAPMTAILIAQQMLGLELSLDITTYDLGRYERGELVVEPSVV
jgi:sarcosine oxidase subunit beta